MNHLHAEVYDKMAIEDNMILKLSAVASMKKHRQAVTAMCWSFDGRYFLSTDKESVLHLWSNDSTPVATQRVSSSGDVNCMKFMPEGRQNIFVYCDFEGGLYIQDFTSKKPLITVDINPIETFVTVETQRDSIFCLDHTNKILMCDLRSKEVKHLQFEEPIDATCFDVCPSHPELFAVGDKNGSIHMFDIRSSLKSFVTLRSAQSALSVWRTHSNTIENVHFNNSGTEIIMNDGYGIAYLFELDGNSFSLKPMLEHSLTDGKREVPNELKGHEQADNDEFCRIRDRIQELFDKKKYTTALTIGYNCLLEKKITSNINISLIKQLRNKCYIKRSYAGDHWAALNEIYEAHLLNSSSSAIHSNLITSLTVCGQYNLARSYIEKHKRIYEKDEVFALEEEIECYSKREDQDFVDATSLPTFTDLKRRYVGLNECFTDCVNVQYFGSEQQYIVTSNLDGQVIVYDKKTALVKTAVNHPSNPLEITIANPVKPVLACAHRDGVLTVWGPPPFFDIDTNRINSESNEPW